MAACKARQSVFSAHPEEFEKVSRDNPFAALFNTSESPSKMELGANN